MPMSLRTIVWLEAQGHVQQVPPRALSAFNFHPLRPQERFPRCRHLTQSMTVMSPL